MRRMLAVCWIAALLHSSGPVRGDPAAAPDWVPLDPERLAELRGGFETTAGLVLSFGIERAVYVNGELLAHTSVEIPDIRHMTPEQAAALDAAANSVVVIRNGPNNNVDIASIAPGTTVIQNTLNDQHIVSLTTLSVDANALSMFQGINIGESLTRSQQVVAGPR